MAIRKDREQEFNSIMKLLDYITVTFAGGSAISYLLGAGLISFVIGSTIPTFYKYAFLLFTTLFFALRAEGLFMQKNTKIAEYGFIIQLAGWGYITGILARIYEITPSQDSVTMWLWLILFTVISFLLGIRYIERGIQETLKR
ncbi:MAG: hypothetical protein M1286_00190 [Candidatus Marsarchaeota archaeon]|nr:hypothetical protein [Candidatus Marsarchaeota archaeon]